MTDKQEWLPAIGNEFDTYVLPMPQPPTDIWDVWWKVPVDPDDENMFASDTRAPKVILNPDRKTFGLSNCPTHGITGVFAANLALVLLAAAKWVENND